MPMDIESVLGAQVAFQEWCVWRKLTSFPLETNDSQKQVFDLMRIFIFQYWDFGRFDLMKVLH